jgi:hypothetical protein
MSVNPRRRAVGRSDWLRTAAPLSRFRPSHMHEPLALRVKADTDRKGRQTTVATVRPLREQENAGIFQRSLQRLQRLLHGRGSNRCKKILENPGPQRC